MTSSGYEKFYNEVDSMLDLSGEAGSETSYGHPSIIKMFHYYEDVNRFYLVSELCEDGDIFSFIDQKRKLEINEAAMILKQVISAVKYMHSKNLVHLDLKPENILIDHHSDDYIQVKLVDFGTALKLVKGCYRHREGTPGYMAPEVLGLMKDESDPVTEYDFKADMWSLGIIAYILVCGEMPFVAGGFGEGDDSR